MPSRSLALPLCALLVATACASAQKLGDRAAATGDWKSAEREYAQAVRDDPSNADLRARWADARARALAAASAHARACAAGQDWDCAWGEADYAVRLDPGNADLAVLRRDAGRSLGQLRLQRADEAAGRGDFGGGLQLLAGARAVTEDPGVRAEAARRQPGLVSGAVGQAEGFRRAGQYPQAVALLSAAAAVDPGVRPRLAEVQAEQQRALAAEAARLERNGDALLGQRRYADAEQAYLASARVHPGGRAAALARDAAAMREGDAATQARDWPRATRAYQAAVAAGVDPGGAAAGSLEAVRVRRWAVRVRSVLARPALPDGQPWVGGRSPVFDAVMIGARAADRAWRDEDPSALRTAIEVARGMPPENVPELVTVVELGGRRMASPPRRALYAVPDAGVVVAANGYDDRAIALEVLQPAAARDLGKVQVRLGDLVSRGRVVLYGGALRVELTALPTEAPEWATVGPERAPVSAPAPAYGAPARPASW